MPIGRQVLQVAGFDERGNQTVVNMTINVAQGPPAPEFNRANGALPDLSPGQSLATSAGDPTSVIVTPFSEDGNLLVDGGDWAINIAIDPNNGTVGGTPEEPIVQMVQSSVGSVSGDGLMPDTEASIWLFSEPTLMGTVKVAADGSFEAEFLVDATFIAAGEHTLQIQGVGEDGYVKAINLGVLIEESVETTSESASSMLWWIIAAGVLVVALIVGGSLVVRRKRLV